MRVSVSIDIGESDMDFRRVEPVYMNETDPALYRRAADMLDVISADIRRMYPLSDDAVDVPS